ncbi:hypothetical protein E2C01_033685 [Portunus trituberculatus]|uniref:Uncharacterized protein n=1 Tax=Portunus trituberculatus TaxID=210409 RepID=A0A5B7EYJ3_PORTR|nr:hypothetical protein [Portunus trituberculatus]
MAAPPANRSPEGAASKLRPPAGSNTAWEFLIVIPLLHVSSGSDQVQHPSQEVHSSTHQHGCLPPTSLQE